MYSVSSSPVIEQWFKSLTFMILQTSSDRLKLKNQETSENEDTDDSISSPEQKISKKDHYFINTMMTLHDTMDRSYKDISNKEPRFKRLEEHRKKPNFECIDSLTFFYAS